MAVLLGDVGGFTLDSCLAATNAAASIVHRGMEVDQECCLSRLLVILVSHCYVYFAL